MRAYRPAVLLLSGLMIALGIALVVRTAVDGGGAGLLFGVLFVAAGAGRLWLVRRRG